MSESNQEMGLGDRIRAAISLKFKSVKQFCEGSGIPYTTIRGYIAEIKKPGFESLVEIIKATGVSGHWLLTGEGNIDGQLNSLRNEAVKEAIKAVQAVQVRNIDELIEDANSLLSALEKCQIDDAQLSKAKRNLSDSIKVSNLLRPGKFAEFVVYACEREGNRPDFARETAAKLANMD